MRSTARFMAGLSPTVALAVLAAGAAPANEAKVLSTPTKVAGTVTAAYKVSAREAPASIVTPSRSGLRAPGDLDPSFGAGGKVTHFFDNGGGNGDYGQDVVVQPDGKIVVVGWAEFNSPDDDFAILRLLPDGALDPTFSGDGKTFFGFDLGGDNTDRAYAVALQPDGKIVVAGSASLDADNTAFAALRVLPDGTLDFGFGIGGLGVVPVGTGPGGAFGVAVQPDGKIVMAGRGGVGPRDFAVVRLGADGLLDPSFSDDGKQTVAFDLGGGLWDEARDLVIQPNGRIVLVGQADDTVGTQFAFARLLANGNLDTSFGGDGKVTITGGDGWMQAVALRPSGEILAAGTYSLFANPDTSFALVQLEPNGDLDLAFEGGFRILDFDIGEPTDLGFDVVIQSDGNSVIVGQVRAFAENWDFAAARFNDAGFLDPSFGDGGAVVVPFNILGLEDRAVAVAEQPNGKIVVAGSAEFANPDFDFAVMRLGGGSPIFLDGFESGDTSAWTVTVP